MFHSSPRPFFFFSEAGVSRISHENHCIASLTETLYISLQVQLSKDAHSTNMVWTLCERAQESKTEAAGLNTTAVAKEIWDNEC